MARALAAEAGKADWRAEMPAVHEAVDAMATEGLVRLSWKGEPLPTREGPYRIGKTNMTRHRIYTTSFASVYPLYVAKAERKGRTKAEVDEIIAWLTGYGAEALAAELEAGKDFETFFAHAPRMNPARAAITGLVCGVRVEAVEEPLMREIRCLDKLIDELARGKKMEKILRAG